MNAPQNDPREEAWERFARELGGAFANEEGWQTDRVTVEIEGLPVTLDFHLHTGYRLESVYTRFVAFLPATGFRFRIFHQELIHRVAHLVGMQDISVGDRAFDRAFVVQGTDEGKVRGLFADPGLRRLLVAEPMVEASLRAPEPYPHLVLPEGADELVLEVPDRVEDGARLRRLYDAFTHLLSKLR